MRGMMPLLAFGLVAVYGLLVMTGLGGVAFAGYWLITSDYQWSSSRSSSSRTTTNVPNNNTGPRRLGGNQPGAGFNPPAGINPPPSFNQPGMNKPGFGDPVQGLDVNANSNRLMNQYRGQITARASSQWGGWEASKTIDGNPNSSWFPTGSANMQQPAWLEVTFPQDVTFKRLTVLGNREPNWPGYGTRKMKVEFRDATGSVIQVHTGPPVKGNDCDFPNLNYAGIRSIKITILEDGNGQRGGAQMTSIGEVQAE